MNEVKKKNYDVKMPHYSNSAVDAVSYTHLDVYKRQNLKLWTP